jgi:microcystin-dependent protein
LFTAISTTYGVGDNSTTFNLPDLRGRVIAGIDNMGGTDAARLDIANTAGTVTGSQYVTIASGNLPTHTHTLNHDHGAFGTSDGAGNHNHGIDSGGHYYIAGGTSFEVAYSRQGGGTSYAGAHNHTIDVPNFTGSTGNGGFANTAMSIMQPTMVMNYIIKT